MKLEIISNITQYERGQFVLWIVQGRTDRGAKDIIATQAEDWQSLRVSKNNKKKKKREKKLTMCIRNRRNILTFLLLLAESVIKITAKNVEVSNFHFCYSIIRCTQTPSQTHTYILCYTFSSTCSFVTRPLSTCNHPLSLCTYL